LKFPLMESKATQEPAQRKEDFRRSGRRKLVPLLKAHSKEKQLQDGTKNPSMKMVSMVIAFLAMNLVTALDCSFYAKRRVGNPNNTVRCWTCNHIGHIAAYCRTMRCYSCSGFGHKAQNCWNKRRKPMRSASYSATKKANEPWKNKMLKGCKLKE